MTYTRKIVGKKIRKQVSKLHRKPWPGLRLEFPHSSKVPFTTQTLLGFKIRTLSGALASEPKAGGQKERKKTEVKLPAEILQVTVLLADTSSFVTLQGISAAKATDNKNTAHLAPERKSGT